MQHPMYLNCCQLHGNFLIISVHIQNWSLRIYLTLWKFITVMFCKLLGLVCNTIHHLNIWGVLSKTYCFYFIYLFILFYSKTFKVLLSTHDWCEFWLLVGVALLPFTGFQMNFLVKWSARQDLKIYKFFVFLL